DAHHRNRHVEDDAGLAIESRAIDVRIRVPFLKLNHHFDALLLAHGANAEKRRNVHQADATYFHIVALQLVTPADEDVGAAFRDDDHVVRHESMPALHKVHHDFGFADAAASNEEQPDAEHVRQRRV